MRILRIRFTHSSIRRDVGAGLRRVSRLTLSWPAVGARKCGGKQRSGSIEEASSCLGKDYSYQWDYAAVRTALQQVAASAGNGCETVLNPKSV